MAKEIQQTWHFNQPPQEVWEYLTKPELMEQWLMKSDFKPVKGHKFRFTFTPKGDNIYKGIVDCEVLEVKPFSRLSYTWNGSTKDGSRTFESKVVWTLEPKENGTSLLLQHTGFTDVDDFTIHNAGWAVCLKRIDELLKTR